MDTVAFALTEPPPPPAAPPKPLEFKQEPVNTALLAQVAVLAPTIIPEEIPVVKKDAFSAAALAVPNGTLGGIPAGVDGGVIGGIAMGEVGGKEGGTIGGVVQDLPADGRVHIARDRKLPMLPLSQVYPSYPEDARLRSWEDDLVVRYIIGKDGRVRNHERDSLVALPPVRQGWREAGSRARVDCLLSFGRTDVTERRASRPQ